MSNFHVVSGRKGMIEEHSKKCISFTCCLASPRPSLGHYRGKSLTHPMLITASYLSLDQRFTRTLETRWDLEVWPSAQQGFDRESFDSITTTSTARPLKIYVYKDNGKLIKPQNARKPQTSHQCDGLVNLYVSSL